MQKENISLGKKDVFHDQDSFCSSILYAAKFNFVDKRSKMVIQKETIYEDFFIVARVLFKYFTVKLNKLLGKIC